MLPLSEICCPAIEQGPRVNVKIRNHPAEGQCVIQAKIVSVECLLQPECPFYCKWHRCPTSAEIQAKYPQAR